MKRKLKLLISYDGTDYCGWQRQKEGLPSVQETLEKALSQLFQEPITVCGASRTDAGVHALGQVAHCSVSKDLERYQIVRALNTLTPSSLVIKKAWEAPEDFHATLSATHKVYKYWVHNSPVPSALRARYTTWVRQPMAPEDLNRYAKFVVGKQDFKSFQSVGTPVKTTVREVYKAEWTRPEPHLLEFTIIGNGFLKQMVRNIVGTQIDLLQKGFPPEAMVEILAARDRRKARTTAPPQGLYLCSVHYPRSLDNKCRKN